MHLDDFLTEQWMNEHENDAVYNMTDTCVEPLSFSALMAMDNEDILRDVVLDYGTITGDIRLKREILKLYRSGTEDSITMTHGCLSANELVMYTFLEPCDTVVTFTPGYQQFTDLPRSIGCYVKEVKLYEEKGWMPDFDELEAAFAGPVRMVILNNPSNPTGTFFDEIFLNTLIGSCRKQGTLILCDEVYRGKEPDEVSVSDLYEYGLSTCSLSKMFSLAGLRLGWVKADPDLIRQINVRRDYSFISAGPLAESAALAALRHQDDLLLRSKSIIADNIKVYEEWLKSVPYASLVIPKHGTVGFLSYTGNMESRELALALLAEDGVFFVPGSCFGCEKHLRIALTREPEKTRHGLAVLAEKLKKINEPVSG